MSEQIREEGVWWNPMTPDQLSVGTLSVTDGRAQLESVVGTLSNVNVADPKIFHSGPQVLNGRSHSGTSYTCFQNYYNGFRQNVAASGGHTVANFDVVHVFKGQNFQSQSAATFDRASFQYSNLHLWLFEIPPIKVEIAPDEKGVFRVEYTALEPWQVNIEDGFEIRNDFLYGNEVKGHAATSTFSRTDGFLLTSATPRPFTDFLPIEHRFRAFVNLLADCQLEVSSEVFRGNVENPSDVHLLGRISLGSFNQRHPNQNRVPVPFASIGDFTNVLSNWFCEYKRLEPIVSLYLFGKHNRFLDIGNTFLGVMQALESFHRTYHPGVFMAQAEFDLTVRPLLNSAIPSFVEEPFRQRLKSAIQYGFELSLRKRLAELVSLLPDSDVFERVREANFRNRAVDTRNTLTHQIPSPAFAPLDGDELYVAIQRWREVIFALVLMKIGVANQIVVAAVERLRRSEGTFVAL